MLDFHQLCKGFAVIANGKTALIQQIFISSVAIVSKRYPGGDTCHSVSGLPLSEKILVDHMGFVRRDALGPAFECPQGKMILAKHYLGGYAVVQGGLDFGPRFESVHEVQLYYLGKQYGILDFDPKWDESNEDIDLSSCTACSS